MPSFRIPTLFAPRHSFNRLRSFHLSPGQVSALATSHAPVGGTKTPIASRMAQKFASISKSIKANRSAMVVKTVRPSNLAIPLRGSTIVKLAIVASLFFILSISMAFLGADEDEPAFKRTLDAVAQNIPGVILLGESVDVDIDEPSITIRWSIVACGDDYMLPDSAGAHGSELCGLPSTAMHIYIDNGDTPAATYDPTEIPFNKDTGARRNIQNLVEFDSDHVLDVHEARLYPFDTYMLSSTIRAVSFDNETIPIRRLATIDKTSSFDILSIDIESFSSPGKGTQKVSRDMDMFVSRPNDARFFAVLLYTVSWLLTHLTVGHVLLARRLSALRDIIPHLVSSGAILLTIPQLRNSMPDAPGFDGVLIDCIGYFPQMIIVALCTITLLLIVVVREFDSMSLSLSLSNSNSRPRGPAPPTVLNPRPHRDWEPSTDILTQFPRPPPSPNVHSTPREISRWELHRMTKHLKGEYVFPPVKPSHRIQPSDHTKPAHRRVKTMSRIMEEGEASHWSEED